MRMFTFNSSCESYIVGLAASDSLPQVGPVLGLLDDPGTYPQGIGHCSNHWIDAKAGRHEAGIDDEHVRHVMQLAMPIQHGLLRIVPHPTGAHLVVADQLKKRPTGLEIPIDNAFRDIDREEF